MEAIGRVEWEQDAAAVMEYTASVSAKRQFNPSLTLQLLPNSGLSILTGYIKP